MKVDELFKDGLPPVVYGIAPVEKWECNVKYCSFFDVCGGGLKTLEVTKWGMKK